MHTAIERESGTTAAIALTAIVYAATHFFASYHIAPAQVSAHSGVDLLLGTLQAFAHPAAIADAFCALLAVGVLLGLVRAATGNIAACIGLHAGWVWVMLVVHELTPAAARSARSASCSAASTASSAGWCSPGSWCWRCRCGGSTSAAARAPEGRFRATA